MNKFLKSEPAYRARQVYQAVFLNLIENWAQATGLPKGLREVLAAACPLDIKAEVLVSRDGQSAKAGIYFSAMPVETVLMKHRGGRNTICVSSQIGCALGCKFCATGRIGFRRHLRYDEIITQVLFFARNLKKQGRKVSNIVFMGMGEPLCNYDEVMRAVKFLNDPALFNIGARKISISTVGIAGGIKRLAGEPYQLNLAVSLHAPDDELRSRLMPVNRDQPLEDVLKAVKKYQVETKRRVMIEYVLLKEVNDRPEQAAKLAALLKAELVKPYFVNLIAYNDSTEFKASRPAAVADFKKVLEKEKITVIERYRFGRDIMAGCGQLAGGFRSGREASA